MSKKNESETVMLRRDWTGQFHRAVRDKEGQVKRTLVFAPGEPVTLSGEDLDACRKDIAKGALVPATLDAKGRPKTFRGEKIEGQPPLDEQVDRLEAQIRKLSAERDALKKRVAELEKKAGGGKGEKNAGTGKQSEEKPPEGKQEDPKQDPPSKADGPADPDDSKQK